MLNENNHINSGNDFDQNQNTGTSFPQSGATDQNASGTVTGHQAETSANEPVSPANNINQWETYQPQSESSSYYDQNAYPNFQPQAAEAVKTKKSGKGKIAALILACMILSAGCGFGGSYAAQKLFGESGSTKTPVLTQSLVNTSNTTAEKGDLAAVVESTQNSVVEITTKNVTTNQFMQQYVTEGAGSGVIITEDGYIITNHHVINGASEVTVRMKDGTEYPAKIIGSDQESDIAVIKVEASGLKAAVLGDSSKLAVGETCLAIGNPLGELGGTVTEGIISALDREIAIDGQTMTLLQTSAAINPGNSGGGLFNAKGELIGIVNAKTSASGIEGLGFAIPINTAKEIAEELMNNGYVTGRVQLGVTLLTIADDQTATQYRVSEKGVYVSEISANSDAYYGGMKVGDRIVSVNGTEITTADEVKQVVEDSSVGDVLKFTVVRGQKSVDLEVTLTEYNSNFSNFGQGQ
jgi:serine protease Do